MNLKQTILQLIRLMSLGTRIGMSVGFGITLLVMIYGGRVPIDDGVILLLCPFSILAIALDNSSLTVAVFGWSLILFCNTIWYAFLFGLAGVLFKKTGA